MVVELYEGIYRMLARDVEVLTLLEIPDGDNLDKALHIQKRSKPQHIVDNLPIIAFYTPGGAPEVRNDAVYVANFVFDVYTNDDVDRAQRIAKRIKQLFHHQIIPLTDLSSFESKFVDGFESATNLPNTYCFSTVLKMSVSDEE